MGFLLLGVDSLIACIAIGPIIGMRVAVPLAALFGVGDGAGFLLGSAFHWSVPDNVSNIVETGVLVVLGLYWIGIAVLSKRMASEEVQSRSRWGVWVLPWVLSIDNITFGIIDGVPAHAIGMAVASLFPAVRKRMALANGICGGLLIAAAGVLLIVG
jgi:hypothetical protein